MTTQQPEALQCAADLEYSIPRHRIQDAFTLNAYKALKMVRTQHARITELESQLAQRFDAADMATAAAQGFRDGVASLAASAGEPMFWVRLCGDGLYEGPIHNARIEEVRKQSGVWSPLYLAAPPTAQAGGWRLVPLEPTQEMIDAMRSSVWLPACYRAMLAAAPTAQAEGWRPIETEGGAK